LNLKKTCVQLERGQLASYWLELAILTSVAFVGVLRTFFACVAYVACVALDGNPV